MGKGNPQGNEVVKGLGGTLGFHKRDIPMHSASAEVGICHCIGGIGNHSRIIETIVRLLVRPGITGSSTEGIIRDNGNIITAHSVKMHCTGEGGCAGTQYQNMGKENGYRNTLDSELSYFFDH
jgi:hypothetical protein